MEHVADKELHGIETSSSDQECIRLQTFIRRYKKDNTEKKDMVFVKYSNRTKRPFPRCHVLAGHLKSNANAAASTLEEARKSLGQYDAMTNIAEEIR